MKVLVGDVFEAAGLSGLSSLGCEVVYEPKLEGEALGRRLAETGAEVLVVRSTKVTAEQMDEARGLALIVRAGAGVNTIDLAAASARAIAVSNCPGKNAVAVAELAWALILSLDRRLVQQTNDLKAGTWNKAEYSKARGIAGQVLGVVGLGAIGREVAVRGQAFGMTVLGWSPSLTPQGAAGLGVEKVDDLRSLAARSDVVTVHVALKKETRGLLDAAFFHALKPGASFVNTSRGEVVNAAALREAIETKGIRAGLDVFEREPSGGTGTFDDPVGLLPGVVGTHHVGASTDQAQNAIAAEVVRIVSSFKASGLIPNAVNLCDRSPASWLLTVRHRDRVGVLAHVFSALKDAGINVQQTENVVFDGAEAATARIQLDSEPGADVLDRIRLGCPDILSIGLKPL